MNAHAHTRAHTLAYTHKHTYTLTYPMRYALQRIYVQSLRIEISKIFMYANKKKKPWIKCYTTNTQ